jgi:VanZ family protein
MSPRPLTAPARNRAWLRAVPAIVWLGVIFAVSSVPGSNVPGGWSVQGHLAEYAVLGILVVFALGRPVDPRVALAVLAFCAFYGLTDELHQILVPGRTCDPLDWTADVLGSSAGISVAIVARRVHARTTARTGGPA